MSVAGYFEDIKQTIHGLHRQISPFTPLRPTAFGALPTIAEGAPIPLIYGRVRVRAPVCAWSGNATSIGVHADGSDSTDIEETASYRYAIDLLFIVGIPFADGVVNYHDIWSGDIRLGGGIGGIPESTFDRAEVDGYALGWIVNKHVFLDAPLGDSQDIGGLLEFFNGQATQVVADGTTYSLVEQRMVTAGFPADKIPGYRKQALAFLTDRGNGHWSIGPSPDIASYSFEVSSFGTVAAFENLPTDANPISVIYDILTSKFSKLGIPASKIDLPSFTAAAETLFDEGHGYSRAIEQQEYGSALIEDVIRQIDGVIYEEPTTGKRVIKLIRNDYVLADIPEITQSNCSGISDYENSGWSDVMNQVRISFIDRENDYIDGVETAQNGSNANYQGGGIRSTEIQFHGCHSRALAQKLAARELAVMSRPMIKLTATVNRSFYATRPGDAVKLTWPDYGIENLPFRVAQVGLGQLHKGEITLELIQDVFGTSAGAYEPDLGVINLPRVEPINHRLVTEAPRFLQLRAANAGTITSPDTQHILALATPDDASEAYLAESKLTGSLQTDMVLAPFTYSGLVTTTYARELEPYDTTTGLVVDFGSDADALALVASLAAKVWQEVELTSLGRPLLLVNGEIMGWINVTDMTGGVVRFNLVYRALLDTSATDHAIGSRVWLIGTGYGGLKFIGRRGWGNVADLSVREVPVWGFMTGSGGDPIDVIDIEERCLMEYPAADFGLAGETLSGTQGLPAVTATSPLAGWYKSASYLESDINSIRFKARDRLTANIVRGDTASEAITNDAVTYALYAQRVDDDEVEIVAGIDPANNTSVATHALLGKAGHGDVDVILHTVTTEPAGPFGFPAAVETVGGWDSPRVRVTAPRWRNLVANARFRYALSALGAAGSNWQIESGRPVAEASATYSMERTATGSYLTGADGVGDGDSVASQTIDITGYDPRGMRAELHYYVRNKVAADTIAVTFTALDAAGSVLATQTMAALVPSLTLWQHKTLTHAALPALTAKLKVTVSLATVKTQAESMFAEASIRVGQYLTNVLGNPTFDTGSTSSWTNVTNSFVVSTTTPYATDATASGYAQGGAFSSSEIRQDYTVATGREFGTAVLTFARMNAIVDNGEVILEARSSGGTVLASSTTGAESMAVLLNWYRRTLYVDLPEGTVTLRVRLLATRTLGAGTSGACFDDFDLRPHLDLDADWERELDYSAPTVQAMPTTWQAWHLAYPDLIDDGVGEPTVFGGTNAFQVETAWSDSPTGAVAATRTGAFVGQFGDGVGSVDGYRFTRQSGSSAVHLRCTGIAAYGDQAFAAPTSADSFTCLVYFRVDELGFASTCGLVGRRDASSGWAMNINASGELEVTLQGDDGAITVTVTGHDVSDGAVHMAAIKYDAATQELWAITEESDANASTTTGLGEIENVSPDVTFRIGRSSNTIDTLPGQIARVYYFAEALTSAQIAAQWTYAQDPTGLAPTHTRSAVGWIPGPSDANGVTLARMATDQIAIGHSAALEADDGTGYGLAQDPGSTNLIPTFDFTDATKWILSGAMVATHGIADATGLMRGITIDSVTGFKVTGLAMTAATTLTVAFVYRGEESDELEVNLRNASGVLKGNTTIATIGGWQLVTHTFTAWDNSSVTCQIEFIPIGGSSVSLTHALWASQRTTGAASIWPDALATIGAVGVTHDETFPLQVNAQGELMATGVATQANTSGTIALVNNGADNKNHRELLSVASTFVPRLDHYDSVTPTNVTSSGTAIDWSQLWAVRGRWCSVSTLDDAATPFAGVVTAGSVASAAYGRSATWAYDATAGSKLAVGGASCLPAYVRSVTLRNREEKLP